MRPVWSHVFFVSVTVAYNNCGIFKKWIICRFDCEHIYLSIVRAPLEISGRDRLLIVKLNKTYTGSPTERIYQRENMYEKTRKYWKLNPEKLNKPILFLPFLKRWFLPFINRNGGCLFKMKKYFQV